MLRKAGLTIHVAVALNRKILSRPTSCWYMAIQKGGLQFPRLRGRQLVLSTCSTGGTPPKLRSRQVAVLNRHYNKKSHLQTWAFLGVFTNRIAKCHTALNHNVWSMTYAILQACFVLISTFKFTTQAQMHKNHQPLTSSATLSWRLTSSSWLSRSSWLW